MRFLMSLIAISLISSSAQAYDSMNLVSIAKSAGDILLEYYAQDIDVDYKSLNSPVTKADIAVNEYLHAELTKLDPSIKVISEESAISDSTQKHFWLIDPMDGTKSFINKTGQFTVNIALIENNKPVLGVVHSPIQKVSYFVQSDGQAYKYFHQADTKQAISVRRSNIDEGLTLVASKLHRSPQDEAFIKAHNVKEVKTLSSSLKFCLIAEGQADIYPRNGTTMEWDTAAGQAVLEAAGGQVLDLRTGEQLLYAKGNYKNPHFIAFGNISDYIPQLINGDKE